jgi:hypothetical protein
VTGGEQVREPTIEKRRANLTIVEQDSLTTRTESTTDTGRSRSRSDSGPKTAHQAYPELNMETVAKQELEQEPQVTKAIKSAKKPIRIATTSQSNENGDDSQQLVQFVNQLGHIQTLEGVQGELTSIIL